MGVVGVPKGQNREMQVVEGGGMGRGVEEFNKGVGISWRNTLENGERWKYLWKGHTALCYVLYGFFFRREVNFFLKIL